MALWMNAIHRWMPTDLKGILALKLRMKLKTLRTLIHLERIFREEDFRAFGVLSEWEGMD